MSTVSEKPSQQKPRQSSEQYTIVADHPRNSDLLIQNIPGMRLRSRISASRTVIANPQNDSRPIPKSQAGMPEVPGMTLTVDLSNGRYFVEDPLFNDERKCEQLKQTLMNNESQYLPKNTKIRGVAPQKGHLGKDEFKTLCREIRNLLDYGEATEVGTPFPTRDAIDNLPGDYLLNPGARVDNTQPRYEKDWEQWKSQLDRSGN